MLKGLVYGCELVFDRENWEVFRLIETASLLPLDSKHIDPLLEKSPYLEPLKQSKEKATGL